MKLLRNFAVPNLTMAMIAVSAGVTGYTIAVDPRMGIVGPHVFEGEWWHLLIFPFRIADGWISLALYLYAFWIFGSALEAEIGDAKYTLYILIGLACELAGVLLLSTVFAGMPTNIHAGYVFLSVFFAAAFLGPDIEILLFFFIPIKIKWLALITAGIMILGAARTAVELESLWPFVGPLLGSANFLIFFGYPLLRRLQGKEGVVRRVRAVAPVALERVSRKTLHRCAVCGRTEEGNPQLDFRYCVDCDDLEYCEDHLTNHKHNKSPNAI